MLILENLQSHWPIIAPFRSIFGSLLEYHSAQVSSTGDQRGSEWHQETNGFNGSTTAETGNEHIPEDIDTINTHFLESDVPSIFPFGNLFEDICLGVPLAGFTSNGETDSVL